MPSADRALFFFVVFGAALAYRADALVRHFANSSSISGSQSGNAAFAAQASVLSRHLSSEALRADLGDFPFEDSGVDGGEGRLPLVPYPALVKVLEGEAFPISTRTLVAVGPGVLDSEAAVVSLRKLISKVASSGSSTHAPSAQVYLAIVGNSTANPESYELTVGSAGVKITAPALAGLAFGARTLEQLILTSPRQLPTMAISDAPTFKWRGLHLDVSRHFFPASDVIQLLDIMAMFKLNRFHWHLTDDQGWRIPIPGYPKLTSKGAGARFINDREVTGEGVEGFYTEEDVKRVVAHATALHIEVIPEVDVPGHAAAAISAYPELGNTDFPPPRGPLGNWGMFKWTLSPTQEAVNFLEAVVDTVAKLFPSEYIHVGGDEAPTQQWSQSRSSTKQRWLPMTTSHVQGFFNARLGEILHSKGKRMAGWDEVQSMDGLPKDATIFAWRSENEMRKALASGRRVVNANNGFAYFDYIQGPQNREPVGQPTVVTLETTFQQCHQFSAKMQHQPLVLGAQGQLWSEYIPNLRHLEYMAFPRAMALAECVWTPPDVSGHFADFRARLEPHLEILGRSGVNFRQLQ